MQWLKIQFCFWGMLVIAWPAKYLMSSRFAAGTHSGPGDPDVFSAAWEGNEKQNSGTACFKHSWAVLAAAVSQHHPSNVLGDVTFIMCCLFFDPFPRGEHCAVALFPMCMPLHIC